MKKKDLQQMEAAGKKSTVTVGGLARLIFGKGEEEDEEKVPKEKADVASASSEEIMKLVEEDSGESNPDEPEAHEKSVVGVEEIKLEMDIDEKVEHAKPNPEQVHPPSTAATAATEQETE